MGEVGIVAVTVDAGRLLSILIGMPAFTAWVFVSRGGWTPVFFFTDFIVGAAFALYGWRREDRSLI